MYFNVLFCAIHMFNYPLEAFIWNDTLHLYPVRNINATVGPSGRKKKMMKIFIKNGKLGYDIYNRHTRWFTKDAKFSILSLFP